MISQFSLCVFFIFEGIHEEMFNVEVEIFKTRSRIKQWVRYRDVTQIEEQRAIQSLQRELAYMVDNYVVLSSKKENFDFLVFLFQSSKFIFQNIWKKQVKMNEWR